MTSLMLASQRNRPEIVKTLILAGSHIDLSTKKNSTALMLASKQGHVDVVKVLLAAGAELMLRDSRGRTARDSAIQRTKYGVLEYLCPEAQILLMRKAARTERNYLFVKIWTLLQQERAHVVVITGKDSVTGVVSERKMTIHDAASSILEKSSANRNEGGGCVPNNLAWEHVDMSVRVVIQAMTLPEPLIELIAGYLPLPNLFNVRLDALRRRCHIDPDSTISCSLDLIDEVLDEAGFGKACDIAKVFPPIENFGTWSKWRAWGKESESNKETMLESRRMKCLLDVLAHGPPELTRILVKAPFSIPVALITRLKENSDIQSVVRRMRGVHFEVGVALDMVILTGDVLAWWYQNQSTDIPTAGTSHT